MQSTFPLRRAVEKVTSHHRYCTELVGFDNSPPLHLFLTLTPSVAIVPDSFDAIQRYLLPDGHDSWHRILSEICNDTTLSLSQVAASLHTSLGSVDQNSYVHSECALVVHYQTHRATGAPPPFGYIGVSKLSCMPCYPWIKVLSQRTGRSYYIRGVHGKWYRGWRAPNLGPDGAPGVLLEMMK